MSGSLSGPNNNNGVGGAAAGAGAAAGGVRWRSLVHGSASSIAANGSFVAVGTADGSVHVFDTLTVREVVDIDTERERERGGELMVRGEIEVECV